MNRYRRVKPELVFGVAAVASMLIGLLFRGYVAEVVQLSLLIFALIGLLVEGLSTREQQHRQRAWLLGGVALLYPIVRNFSLFIAIPLIFVAGFLVRRLLSSDVEL